jgi:Tfp pilus assembly protein PilF
MSEARIRQLLAFLDEDPGDTFTRFALALEYIKSGNPEMAEKLFTGILNTDPGYVGVYYHLGKLYESLGDTDRAATTYGKGIEAATQAGEVHARSELEAALADCGE